MDNFEKGSPRFAFQGSGQPPRAHDQSNDQKGCCQEGGNASNDQEEVEAESFREGLAQSFAQAQHPLSQNAVEAFADQGRHKSQAEVCIKVPQKIESMVEEERAHVHRPQELSCLSQCRRP